MGDQTIYVGYPRPLTAGAAAGGHDFRCPHITVGNVESAECGICGPMEQVQERAG